MILQALLIVYRCHIIESLLSSKCKYSPRVAWSEKSWTMEYFALFICSFRNKQQLLGSFLQQINLRASQGQTTKVEKINTSDLKYLQNGDGQSLSISSSIETPQKKTTWKKPTAKQWYRLLKKNNFCLRSVELDAHEVCFIQQAVFF